MPTYNKLPSNLTGSEVYYVSSNWIAPNLRTGIGSGTSAICTVRKDTLVTMVQYNAGTDSYGTPWHRIRLEDGTEGYMTSEYLTKVNNIIDTYSVPSQPAEGNNGGTGNNTGKSNMKFEQDKCIVTPSTTIADIKKLYTVTSATKDGNNVGDYDSLPTGAIIETNIGKFTVVKLGDVSGDGIVDTRDSLRILKYSVGTYQMKDEYYLAGDLSKDGVIDTRDSLRILKYSVGTYSIEL